MYVHTYTIYDMYSYCKEMIFILMNQKHLWVYITLKRKLNLFLLFRDDSCSNKARMLRLL